MRIFVCILLYLTVSWAQDLTTSNIVSLSDSTTTDLVNLDSVLFSENIEETFAVMSIVRGTSPVIPSINIDSILTAEITKYDLVSLIQDPIEQALIFENDSLCLTDSCFMLYATDLEVTDLLIWELTDTPTDRQLALSVYSLQTPETARTTTFALADQKLQAEQEVRKAVWSIFDQTAPPGLFEDQELKKWQLWIKESEIRLFLSSVGVMTIITWIALQSQDEDPVPEGIGQPPAWPAN
ncbi:MAG: hypothetical protein U9Q77_05720 [Candidatus Marinimicrobia bacterium]|nr:hypothetical protein [Candidatus Neomarinimicrobiota bacterium]